MKKWWWIKYSVLTIAMAVVWLIWLNSVPADDPGDIVGVGIACVIPPIIYIILLLGFAINDLKKG